MKTLKLPCKKKIIPLHTKIARSIPKEILMFGKPAKKPVIKSIY